VNTSCYNYGLNISVIIIAWKVLSRTLVGIAGDLSVTIHIPFEILRTKSRAGLELICQH